MKYGVIGEHLPHSFSKLIHERLESYTYDICEIAPDALDDFLKARDFCGINVTIPYKERVIPYLDVIDPLAKTIGAINTVVNQNGKLYGYNTDILGLKALIEKLGLSIKGKKVLILGTGGTAKTAKALANHEGASEVYLISHNQAPDAISYTDAYRHHSDAEILIHTTPCGMFPNIHTRATDENGIPLSLDAFKNLEGVVDVVYNPLRTTLVQEAKARNIAAIGGLYMLVAQAVYAAAYFTEKEYPTSIIDEIYHELLSKKENIVLIGMPSSGKTTVGKTLAALTGRKLYDTDTEIVNRVQKSIPEIFKSEGESAFRRYEAEAIASLAPITNAIIATGGGAILQEDNLENLRYNGRLYFLDRPLSLLTPTADRPTAQDKAALEKRYRERYPRYLAAADRVIEAKDLPEAIAKDILHRHKER